MFRKIVFLFVVAVVLTAASIPRPLLLRNQS